MSPPPLLLAALLSLQPAASSGASTRPVTHDASARAWALVHAGRLWTCWAPAARCFEPVVLELPTPSARAAGLEPDGDEDELEHPARGLDPTRASDWRLGFGPTGELWIELDGHRWRLEPGTRRAQSVDREAPVRLERPRELECSPTGALPRASAGGLAWTRAPVCTRPPPSILPCAPPPGPRLRQPTPLRLRAGVQLRSARGRLHLDHHEGRTWQRAVGLELLFVVEIGLASRAWTAHRDARAALLQRHRAPRVFAGSVPPMLGELYTREQAALSTIVCAQGPQ